MQSRLVEQKPVIFEYEDYRLFLKDLYLFNKGRWSYFSHRYFSKRAGFKSPNFLKLVIEGKRNLSISSIDKFSYALKLNKIETEFFSYLVQFNQAKNNNERSWFAQKLLHSRGFRKIRPIKQAEYSYYMHWYYIPVREMLNLKNFKEDPVWIAQQFSPPLSVEMVEGALKNMLDLGLIYRDQKNKLSLSHKSLSTEDEVSSNLIKQYHKKMIQMASDSIDEVSREFREISSVCVPVSENTRSKVKKMIQQFRKEVLAVAAEDEGTTEVYQLNLQWFPIINNTGEQDD